MFYYLYEIKNNLSGKIYVGVHKTKNMDDGYMGSGKVILRAIQKNGIKNFTKTILETFDNSDAMFTREKEVVTDEFLSRADTYNLRRGGTGGFDYINAVVKTMKEKSRVGKLGQQAIRDMKVNRYADDYKSIFADSKFQAQMVARSVTPAAIAKRKQTLVAMKHQQGQNNSQFGTCWIYCDWLGKNVKIKKDVLPYYLDQGWSKGRKDMGC